MAEAPRSAAALVGAWTLVSYVVENRAGQVIGVPFGDHPLGTLVYTPDGRVLVHAMAAGRPLCGSERLVTCPDATKIAAFDTYFGYAGRYVVDAAGVHHQVDVSSFPDWSGSTLHRTASLEGDLLVLAGPRDADRVPVLAWTREERAT